jgi:uncharacterized protein YcaQ
MSAPPLALDHLRRFAVARSLFAPTTLRRALARLGFVQADPIRAPARAQDLILRPRVKITGPAIWNGSISHLKSRRISS